MQSLKTSNLYVFACESLNIATLNVHICVETNIKQPV